MIQIRNLITILLLTLVLVANGQDDRTNSLSFRGVAGLNISSLTGSDVSDDGSRVSFNLGFGIDIPFNNKWSFSPEVIYSRQGFKSDILGIDIDGFPFVIEEGVVFSQDYLNLPLIFRFKPIDEFYVFAGPQIGLLVNESNNSNVVSEDDFINRAAPVYFAGTLGAGASIYKNLGIRASYQFGLSRTYKDLEITDFLFEDENIEFKAYHSVFNISLIYTFGF